MSEELASIEGVIQDHEAVQFIIGLIHGSKRMTLANFKLLSEPDRDAVQTALSYSLENTRKALDALAELEANTTRPLTPQQQDIVHEHRSIQAMTVEEAINTLNVRRQALLGEVPERVSTPWAEAKAIELLIGRVRASYGFPDRPGVIRL